ncbi:UTP--glucose-1-phosphate uridylyltransferase GalU [Marinimicrobium sp. C6131]|uniref:UTP--glucose-1-phosphate uridylyltransferase GalU n=1 Tax=Marinimicrobium sp. C6131 TaxID=3022676 RepID=UPI00223CCDB9|nr:UTP--glucose-1-phosphate uridylyltransferase GalU [Marinimicrobium sp. C6131]UZJ45267.1 UTP--glucose-1-phosphate uridylyltransferase GalU [Marinimicrobium sp. C6131]
MQIKKAVIPVAGLGTRMLPATKAIPKEMLPVVDRPLIQYVIEEAAAAGIKEIVLVTHASKNSIENHFDTSFELEAQLEARLKRSLLEEVRSITPPGLTVISVRQAEAKGLGHAILCARPVVGEEPFAVMLPDVLIDKHHCNLRKDNLAAMTRRFDETGSSQILVEEVPWEQVHKYGVVDCDGAQVEEGQCAAVKGMVEKPERDAAPSNMAIVGRYVLSRSTWDLLAKTQPGAGGEIQLTDSLDALVTDETVEAYRLLGKSHDCGSKLGYMMANIEYGVRHHEIGEQFDAYLKSRQG